jgi:uncharacterized membrane protein YeaQ/YmgE (transglycosylase-associated protein family)
MADRTILGWLLIGLVAGVLAKLLTPGRDPGGIVVTVLIGIAGALLAGFVAQTMNLPWASGWPSYGAAIIGSVALLLVYRVIMARRS